MDVNVLCVKDDPNAVIPSFESDGAAGADLYSVENVTLEAGERVIVSTGLKVALMINPELKKHGYKAEMQVRPRSGLAAKKGITVVNAPGTVDEDYRGIVKVILLNTSSEPVEISIGDRIAQSVIKVVPPAEYTEVDELPDETTRGEGGFGSTGA